MACPLCTWLACLTSANGPCIVLSNNPAPVSFISSNPSVVQTGRFQLLPTITITRSCAPHSVLAHAMSSAGLGPLTLTAAVTAQNGEFVTQMLFGHSLFPALHGIHALMTNSAGLGALTATAAATTQNANVVTQMLRAALSSLPGALHGVHAPADGCSWSGRSHHSCCCHCAARRVWPATSRYPVRLHVGSSRRWWWWGLPCQHQLHLCCWAGELRV